MTGGAGAGAVGQGHGVCGGGGHFAMQLVESNCPPGHSPDTHGGRSLTTTLNQQYIAPGWGTGQGTRMGRGAKDRDGAQGEAHGWGTG